METDKKVTKWLLVDVPDDIVELVRDYQLAEMRKCNCRFGIKKSIISLLRKAYPNRRYSKLQDEKCQSIK